MNYCSQSRVSGTEMATRQLKPRYAKQNTVRKTKQCTTSRASDRAWNFATFSLGLVNYWHAYFRHPLSKQRLPTQCQTTVSKEAYFIFASVRAECAWDKFSRKNFGNVNLNFFSLTTCESNLINREAVQLVRNRPEPPIVQRDLVRRSWQVLKYSGTKVSTERGLLSREQCLLSHTLIKPQK